jgi:ABC-type proline/glycine betaine transport system substrate-binding protein
MNLSKRQFEAAAILILLVICLIALLLSSCNVTRTVTTTAQTIQRGDTTTVIMTKTIESYDGKVDASKLLQAGQAASGL